MTTNNLITCRSCDSEIDQKEMLTTYNAQCCYCDAPILRKYTFVYEYRKNDIYNGNWKRGQRTIQSTSEELASKQLEEMLSNGSKDVRWQVMTDTEKCDLPLKGQKRIIRHLIHNS